MGTVLRFHGIVFRIVDWTWGFYYIFLNSLKLDIEGTKARKDIDFHTSKDARVLNTKKRRP